MARVTEHVRCRRNAIAGTESAGIETGVRGRIIVMSGIGALSVGEEEGVVGD